eukprot:TRINITY_DN7821_c0_g1_i1.p1 TRINITY_DN7821_c0_g1~~TRINITY_DN7821_c0_g1_i1.p1  ORF type:complete len:266 (-),score=60.86 TRINITY_DN7821_c0_g1_i1:441-1124(-)
MAGGTRVCGVCTLIYPINDSSCPVCYASCETLAESATLNRTVFDEVTKKKIPLRFEKVFSQEKISFQLQHILVREVLSIDQWSELFKPLIQQYQSPSAICGYLSCAGAILTAKRASAVMTVQQVVQLLEDLANPTLLLPEIEKAMKFILDSRMKWVQTHPEDFSKPGEGERYLKAWVANYEISDYFAELKKLGELPCGINFLRAVQLKEWNIVSHEEKLRLVEEKPF